MYLQTLETRRRPGHRASKLGVENTLHGRTFRGRLADMNRARVAWMLPLCALAALSCGLFDDPNDDGDTAGDSDGWGESDSYDSDSWGDSWGPGPGPTGSADTNDSSIDPTGADNDPEEGCPCAPGTELIYVLSDAGTIWSFDPETLQLSKVADILCGGHTSTFSMGVSRKARAWVQYQHGDIYTVDLNDPNDPIACLDPGFPHGHPKFPNFGMAFVANSPTDTCDKLYAHSAFAPDVIGPGSGALGVIDPYTIEISEVAPLDYGWGELTGTATGRLFAYQGSAPPLLNEYNKDTGELLDTIALPGLTGDSAFAFAWWGGDFYLFHDPDSFGGASDVWHLDYDESDGPGQMLTKVVSQAPIRVVGAGVSTCVPTGPM